MVFGALVFQTLESRPGEGHTARNLTQSLERDLMHNATIQEINRILDRARTIAYHENEAVKTDWTFYSSLYFVGSVITTIGEFKLKAVT